MEYSWEAITLFVVAIVAFGHLNWRITLLERQLKEATRSRTPAES